MAIFQCISYADITARCLPGEREICGRSSANKKLITKSSEVKKPHGATILFFALLAVFRLSAPSPLPPSLPNSMPIPFYLLIMQALVPPSQNANYCAWIKFQLPPSGLCGCLSPLPLSSLSLSPLSSHLPVARKITLARTTYVHYGNVDRTCVYNMHMQPMHYYLRRNTYRDKKKKYDESVHCANIFNKFRVLFSVSENVFKSAECWIYLSNKLSKHLTNCIAYETF